MAVNAVDVKSAVRRRVWPVPSRIRLAFIAGERLRAWAAMDLPRLTLLAPVCIAIGAGLYFGLKQEPAWYWGPAVLTLGAACCAMLPAMRLALMGALLTALGFCAADWRTAQVSAPQLSRESGIVEVSGRLLTIEESETRRRFVLAVEAIEGMAAQDTPARVRISWRGKAFDALPGDRVSIRAGLSPPPPPVAPGGFDFARQLYFQRIGAVGFAVSAPVVDPSAHKNRRQRAAAAIETMRLGLFHRITSAAPGEGGAIVAAIVTGKRDAISERSEAALRDAGLAHLLAISGLHMGLATGLVFFLVRYGLAAIEPVALRFPIKKWAAAVALASGVFYLILSGGGWSARRAFIMAGIMFAAMLVDRRALSLRNVAAAAVIILLTTPEALFHPGFQMSFAAVTALIAAYEFMGPRADPNRSFAWPARLRRYLVALGLTDVIAALATAPYALYHFNRVALYSLPANMAAMPLMGVAIVPAALAALALAPFGLDGWAWRMAALGMQIVVTIAAEVSSWRGAVSLTAQWPLAAMLALTAGGLLLCISRAPWRLGGVLAAPLSAVIVVLTPSPVLYVAPSGLNAGVVASGAKKAPEDMAGAVREATYDGSTGDLTGFAAYKTRKDRFAISRWKEAAGLDPETAPTIAMEAVFPCDTGACVANLGTASAVFINEVSTLAEDCARAALVVAFFPAPYEAARHCDALLIDRRAVWRNGAHIVYAEPNGVLRVKTANDVRGRRPWTGAD